METKKIIPLFRQLIHESTDLDLNNILNSNSFFKTDVSVFQSEEFLKNRDHQNFCLFDLKINNFLFLDDQVNKSILYKLKFTCDFYGNQADQNIIKFYQILNQQDGLEKLRLNQIAVNKIEMNSFYETLNNTQWLRGNVRVEFNYEVLLEDIDEVIEKISDLNIL